MLMVTTVTEAVLEQLVGQCNEKDCPASGRIALWFECWPGAEVVMRDCWAQDMGVMRHAE
eukprot:8708379-Prorocentrum_lima.AAC.1